VPGLVKLAEALEAEIVGAGAAGREPTADDTLSADELLVLERLPGDLTYRDIANRLALRFEAVRAHGVSLRRKLRAATRDEAVATARRLELI
jgi:ATP/maltotriose-dependent transcriptional regulator MalT